MNKPTTDEFIKGLWRQNPIFVQMLGLCPALAVSNSAINSLAMDATGIWTQVAEGLRFLARYQRDDGKIPHEISQAAASIPWFTEFPYAYYHADTTPYWLVALWRYCASRNSLPSSTPCAMPWLASFTSVPVSAGWAMITSG